MDRNDYYGGESTSLNLIQVCIWKVLAAVYCMIPHPYLCFPLLLQISAMEEVPGR